jgi:abscisic-aldehyde oxidase
MRAPGEVQGSYIAETVIEHVASTLSMDVDSVRNINFHRYDSLKLFYDVASGDSVEYTLTSIWNKLAEYSSFKQRVEIIKEFNRCEVWKKRGIYFSSAYCASSVRGTDSGESKHSK